MVNNLPILHEKMICPLSNLKAITTRAIGCIGATFFFSKFKANCFWPLKWLQIMVSGNDRASWFSNLFISFWICFNNSNNRCFWRHVIFKDKTTEKLSGNDNQDRSNSLASMSIDCEDARKLDYSTKYRTKV